MIATTQVSQQLQQFFGEKADQVARETQFVQRQSKSMSENSYGLAAWERSRRLSIMRVAAAYTIASLVSTSTS